MKYICAWCQRFLRGIKNSTNVSHGICVQCAYSEFGTVLEAHADPWELWTDIGGEG